jgi:glycosyltransferase involved in cell wall biosynthesis
MKILLVNNFHYPRGGAERAYFDVAKILQEQGHEVAFFASNHPKTLESPWRKYFVRYYELSNPKEYSFFNKIKIALRIFYKFETRRKVRALIKEFKPDVAHLHNIFHHLTPSVIDELKKQEIPMVMTVHDFQFVCPNNILFSEGKIWENSKGGKFYKCVNDRCIKGSYSQSFLGMIETYFHRWRKTIEKVDVLISPSNFLIEKSREFGFGKEIIKIPNPILRQEQNSLEECLLEERPSWLPKEKYVAFIGRLSPEKGVDDLIRAFASLKGGKLIKETDPELFLELKLVIMGDGPRKAELLKLVNELGIFSQVVFLDYDKEKHDSVQAGALAMISPSKCYENAPYSVLDALSLKKPVICANLGGQKEIIEDGKNGMLFESGNVLMMARKIREIVSNEEKRKQISENSIQSVKDNFDEKVVIRKLENVYENVLEGKKKELKTNP